MKHRFELFIIVILLLLVFTLSVIAQDAGPAQVGLRPDAPTYALHGPYWVGTQTLVMDEGTDNELRFTVWYPAENPEGLAEDVVYIMAENHGLRTMLPSSVPFTVTGHALADAAPDLSAAPYPLVIYSHGFTAPMWYMYIGEHLASYGFVVIAPEHANDSWSNVYTSNFMRLFEIQRTINDAEILTAEGAMLAGMIDVERIAVGGHSAGGMISYGAGGASLDWASIEAYCVGAPDDPGCANLAGQRSQVYELLGVDEATEGLLPPVWDARVDAIFPMAGSVEMSGQPGLETLTVPMLSMFGSADPYAYVMSPAYDYAGSSQKARVIFEGGGHGIFYNQCETFPYLLDYGLFWGCSDEVWDLARAHDLINHLTTAFLLSVLYDDADATAALTPDNVSFTGVLYEATGF